MYLSEEYRVLRNKKRRASYGGRDESGLTAKQRQMKKDRQLITELDSKGFTQSEIAKGTGFSQSKVARLRAEIRKQQYINTQHVQ